MNLLFATVTVPVFQFQRPPPSAIPENLTALRSSGGGRGHEHAHLAVEPQGLVVDERAVGDCQRAHVGAAAAGAAAEVAKLVVGAVAGVSEALRRVVAQDVVGERQVGAGIVHDAVGADVKDPDVVAAPVPAGRDSGPG
jgi:hypothetical protein